MTLAVRLFAAAVPAVWVGLTPAGPLLRRTSCLLADGRRHQPEVVTSPFTTGSILITKTHRLLVPAGLNGAPWRIPSCTISASR